MNNKDHDPNKISSMAGVVMFDKFSRLAKKLSSILPTSNTIMREQYYYEAGVNIAGVQG
ncbi:MAG: hypothetical protein HUJ51_05050 [Eggerthellaceae bacterium]|nr:hypothetical protein [Eggerthellaceae bacterium]